MSEAKHETYKQLGHTQTQNIEYKINTNTTILYLLTYLLRTRANQLIDSR